VDELPVTVESALQRAVVASSRGRGWPGIDVMTARIAEDGFEVDGLHAHTIAINAGRSFRVEGRIDGRLSAATMEPGTMKLVEAGPRSVWRWDAGEAIEMLHVSLADDDLCRYAADAGLRGRPEFTTRLGVSDERLRQLAVALAAELRSPPARTLAVDALRIEFILRLLGTHSSLAGREAIPYPRGTLALRTLRALDDFVHANLGADITIAELAAVAGMSRFHFSRVFRSTVGRTPHQFVLARRLERARELLRSSATPLRDIASATGFADQSHLSRLVKRHFGVTPGALRAS
jgi:AraC family transcriptional regulator